MTVYWPKIEAGKGNRVAGTRWAICFCCLLGWGLWFSSLVVPSTKASWKHQKTHLHNNNRFEFMLR